MAYHTHRYFHPTCQLLLFAIFFGISIKAVAQEDSGRALYHSGEGAIAVLLQGKVKVPAERFPCANCHGKDGMGGREGATVIPPISWKLLSQPATSRPAYTVKNFRNAVLSGVAANGENLGELMPRYEIDAQTFDSLVDYLKTLDSEQREGIKTRVIQISPPTNHDERLGFIEAIKRFNQAGGSYGRTIVTQFEDQHFLKADSFSQVFKESLGQAIQTQLLKSVADDGISAVALSTGEPELAIKHELTVAGLQYDESAPTMMILGIQSADRLQLDSWVKLAAQAKTKLNSSSNAPLRIYASTSAVSRLPEKFFAGPHELVLVDMDETSVRWALSKRYSARAASGFAMGTLLGEAILLNGRDPTRHAVLKSMNQIDLSTRLFTWRSAR